MWWATVDRYSPGTQGECKGLINRICNLFIIPPNVDHGESHYWSNNNNKTNNSLLRHSDSVSSVWLSCSFCLYRIQFSSIKYIFIYIKSIVIKILSSRKPEPDSQPAAVVRKRERSRTKYKHAHWVKQTPTSECSQMGTSAEHQLWSQHCYEAL